MRLPITSLSLLALAAHTVAGQNSAARPALLPRDSSHVIVLGAGTPNMSADRSGTSLAVVVRGTLYTFDAGPGVERRLFEAQARLPVPIDRYGPVFITHLHSDHTLGLPAMLYHARNGPRDPFRVVGPPGIRRMMGHIVEAFSEDRHIRVTGTQQLDSLFWVTDVAEVTKGMVYRDSNVTVTAFEVPHGAWPHALAYRVETPDRVLVISGDTRPSDVVARACNGCDILFHAVYARDTPYGREYHTTPSQLGGIAAAARPKLLVLYHPVLLGRSPADVLREVIAGGFQGPTILARDLDYF